MAGFQDILDEWERRQQQIHRQKLTSHGVVSQDSTAYGGKVDDIPATEKTAAPPKSQGSISRSTGTVDALTAWIRIHGVVDKDRELDAQVSADAEYRRKEHYRLVHKKPDAMIDLHGLT
ncbi:MAG: hypothetical protein SNJ56_03900, partial [Termitinemataceae bacterium]